METLSMHASVRRLNISEAFHSANDGFDDDDDDDDDVDDDDDDDDDDDSMQLAFSYILLLFDGPETAPGNTS